jgi:ribonuclease P protein component
MIPKKFRFSSRLFDRSFSRSKKIVIDGFLFLISPARGAGKFAVVVGKKVSKKAVVRNRLRRQVYEILRTELLGKNLDKNIIFLYRGAEILDASAREKLTTACQKLLKKIS